MVNDMSTELPLYPIYTTFETTPETRRDAIVAEDDNVPMYLAKVIAGQVDDLGDENSPLGEIGRLIKIQLDMARTENPLVPEALSRLYVRLAQTKRMKNGETMANLASELTRFGIDNALKHDADAGIVFDAYELAMRRAGFELDADSKSAFAHVVNGRDVDALQLIAFAFCSKADLDWSGMCMDMTCAFNQHSYDVGIKEFLVDYIVARFEPDSDGNDSHAEVRGEALAVIAEVAAAHTRISKLIRFS